MPTLPIRVPAAMILWYSAAALASDLWELPPIRYAETPAADPIAQLISGMADGSRKLDGATPLERLRSVLSLLGIPPESQILVFSKTSKQNALIHPANPRSLFFNENAYVGYVPGGQFEVIIHDPLLGVVFYLIDPGDQTRPPKIVRDESECLSCHGTARTELVPGTLVRSVFPDDNGQPLLSLGSFITNQSSPIGERWGGYYVTGRSSLPHFGNRTYREADGRQSPVKTPVLLSLQGKIDTTRYLRPTSDIVALMVLEHQCGLQNLLTAASMQYRRIRWLQTSLNPDADTDTGSAGRYADDSARKIVEALLFKNEAALGADGIEGDPAFQAAFGKRFPHTKAGHSLADFNLNDRLFKHRCSYMIYSKAFSSLPDRVKTAVFKRLHEALRTDRPDPGAAGNLTPQESRRIDDILRETVPAYSTTN